MPYIKSNNGNGSSTVLVARQGYSGLGYTSQEMSLPWCGNLAKDSTQICRSDDNAFSTSFGSNRGAGGGGGGGGSGSPSTLSTIGSFLGAFAGSGLASFGKAKAGPGQQGPFIAPPSGPSPMVIVAVVGGVGLLALLLMRPRSAPRTNPRGGRRRKTRRARRNRSRSRPRRYSAKAHRFIAKRMRDFGARRMYSSSGRRVTSQRQAIAIAMSEARGKGMKVPRMR